MTTSLLPIESKDLPMYQFIGIILGILIIIFLILLTKYLLRKIDPPTNEDDQIFEQNKSLPKVSFEARPSITVRLSSHFLFVLFAFVFTFAFSVSVALGTFLLIAAIFTVLLTGMKFVSFVEFNADGILFYTRLYRSIGYGGKYFIPYEKCYIGFMSGYNRRGAYTESLIINKAKLPYVSISMRSWGKCWTSINSELRKRLPKSHLPKKYISVSRLTSGSS